MFLEKIRLGISCELSARQADDSHKMPIIFSQKNKKNAKILFSTLRVKIDCVLQIDAHDDDVNAVAFADNTSQILFSGGDDGLCKVSRKAVF